MSDNCPIGLKMTKLNKAMYKSPWLLDSRLGDSQPQSIRMIIGWFTKAMVTEIAGDDVHAVCPKHFE